MKDNKNKQKISSLLVGNFNSPPRMSEYISSRRQKLSTPLIGKLRDRDGDLTPDWIDCDPNDPTQHGFWSSAKSAVSKAVSAVKSAVSSGYKAVDKAVGGKLPGGVPSSSGSTPAPSSSTSTSSSKSSGGGGSSGASKVFQQAVSGQSPTIQSAVGMGQSVAPTPAQTTTTKTGSFVPGKGFVTSDGKTYPTSNPSWTPPGYTSTNQTNKSLVVSTSGGVKIYNEKGVEQTFTGNAIVPGTGKTANQLQQELIRQGVESGMGTRNLTSYGYYGTPTTTTSTTGTGNNFQAYNNQVASNIANNQSTTTQPNLQIDPRTGKYYGTYTSAPSKSEVYKGYVEDEGYIKGTLSFLGDSARVAYSKYQDKTGDYYQSEGVSNLVGGGVRYGPYFIPGVGPGLLFAGGAEELLTPGGRERTDKRAEAISQQYNINPVFAGLISEAIPIAETTLGYFGLKGDIARGQAWLSSKATPTTKFIGTERAVGDKVVTDTISTTKQGAFNQYQFARTLSTTGGDKSAGITQGLVVTSRPSNKFFSIKGFNDQIFSFSRFSGGSSGRILGAGTQTGVVGYSSPTIDSATISQTKNIGTGFKTRFITRTGGQTNTGNVLGAFDKIDDATFGIRGGSNVKMRVYRDKGFTYVTEPSITGKIVRITDKVDDTTGIVYGQRGGGANTPLSKTFGQDQATATSTLFRPPPTSIVPPPTNIIPKIDSNVLRIFPISLVDVKTDTRQENRNKTNTAPLSLLNTQQDTRQDQTPSITNIFSTGTTTRTDQAPRVVAIPAPKVDTKVSTIAPISTIPRPTIPKPVDPIIGGFWFPEERKKLKSDVPYDAFVYRDATKKQKARWELVANNVPLITALSRGAREVDNSASTEFKVVRDKGKVNQIIDTAWNSLRNKFRDYTQKSGIKVGLRPGRYLEKRQFRIDSPGEVRAIPGQASIGRRFGRL